MPRIDPVQLLKCLSVLLTPEGGMKAEEVTRLVGLMTKFSKKLVSKCIYILILKNTQTELLDTFMAEGGWTLIQTWLQDAVHTSNRHLIKEIIGLLLITPVDVERLKTNILPKLIKSLSRRDDLEDVAELSSQLVKHWLVIVKGSSGSTQPQALPEKMDTSEVDNTNGSLKDDSLDRISPNSFYKKDAQSGKTSPKKEISIDSSKEDVDMKDMSSDKSKDKEEKGDKDDKTKSSSKSSRSTSSSKDKDKSRDKDRLREKERSKSSSSSSKSSSSRSKSSSSSSSSRDKDRKDRDKEREKEKSRSKDKSRDKDRDKSKDKEKDKHRNNGATKSNSSNSKEKKEEKNDKDKSDANIFDMVKTPSIEKLGRIPKKSSSSSNDSKSKDKDAKEYEMKKKAFSVGIKKDATPEERPKTVKIFNSKMRSTGLEEEVKPAPSRTAVKKPANPVVLPPIPLKRTSPPRDVREPGIPPEKKIKMDKVDLPDRPGAIKLIPPKPKPMLQESDLFNDALTAATSKKEPKKRRRRLSSSKDTPTSPTSPPREEQPLTPTTSEPAPTPTPAVSTEAPAESPLELKNIAPINFYQDTLSEEVDEKPEEDKENSVEVETTNLNDDEMTAESENKENEIRSPRAVTPTEDDPEELKRIQTEGVPKGVLLHSKRKGPKKSISWKNDTDLVEIRYFDLDETERVNVTKAFNDMAKMEYSNEREALQLSRKVGGEDLMAVQIVWRIPFEIDVTEPLVAPGSKSFEKEIQYAREKSVLQAFYFDRRKIPDSPEEPITENHPIVDPIIIALDDPDGQEIDLKSTPWPEPKTMLPSPEPQMPMVYPNLQPQYNPQFNNMNPPNFMGPRFSGPNGPNGPMGPQIHNNFVPNNMIPNNNMLGMSAPNMIQPNDMLMGPMTPNMFQPGPMMDGYNPGPPPESDYPPMFGNHNGPVGKNINSFPPKNFSRDSRHSSRGSSGFRRGRGGSDGGWVNMGGGRGGGNWRSGRGGSRGGRLCKHIQNHGYCRNGDKCAFIHP